MQLWMSCKHVLNATALGHQTLKRPGGNMNAFELIINVDSQWHPELNILMTLAVLFWPVNSEAVSNAFPFHLRSHLPVVPNCWQGTPVFKRSKLFTAVVIVIAVAWFICKVLPQQMLGWPISLPPGPWHQPQSINNAGTPIDCDTEYHIAYAYRSFQCNENKYH